jgi:hypothetical protein
VASLAITKRARLTEAPNSLSEVVQELHQFFVPILSQIYETGLVFSTLIRHKVLSPNVPSGAETSDGVCSEPGYELGFHVWGKAWGKLWKIEYPLYYL